MTSIQSEDCRYRLAIGKFNKGSVGEINVLIAILGKDRLNPKEVVAIQREEHEFLGKQSVKEPIPLCRVASQDIGGFDDYRPTCVGLSNGQ